MADEPVSQVAAAAPAAVTSPLSSPAASPSEPAANASPAVAASPNTPASPAGTEPTATTRPDGIPDSYWDADANTLKVDAAALAADLKERDELKTFKAAEDVRKGSLPANPDAYKLELPADFKAPPGVEFKLDAANPALGHLKQFAHKHGLTQAAVTELLGVYAGNEVGSQAAVAEAKKAEIAKLGTTAPARVDNVLNWLSGMDSSSDRGDAAALGSMLVTARQVEAFERIITKLTSQGSASFSQSHRVAPDQTTIPGYDKMTFAQRRQAQDQLAARKTG